MNSLVKATAAVTVLAARAAASYIFTGFLLSPPFLWLAVNVIIIWLLSSSRRRNTAADDDASSSANDVLNAVDGLYPSSSDYERFAAVVSSGGEAPVASKPKRQAREAKAARRTDRVVRLPKKPAGEAATRTAAVENGWPDAGDKKRDEETPRTVAAARPEDTGAADDVSLDSLWQSMVQRRAARPVAVRKSETWGNDELPRLQRAAETAAKRREMRKSVSLAAPPPPPPPPEATTPPSAVRQLGWRTRDVLVRAQDDLLRRAESLIRRHHEQLRLQRQESEQRQAMEQQRRRQPALIRV